MKAFSPIFLGLVLFSQAAAADLKTDIYNCTLKKGELERLSCYDSAAKQNGIYKKQTNAPKVSGKGKWMVSEDINPIDDSKTSYLSITATSGKGRYGDPITLNIRCKSNETTLYINWSSYLGADSSSVVSRIGSNQAVTNNWSHSTDSKATFRSRPIRFIRAMLGEAKAVFQTTPYNENPITAVFDISGIENAIKPLQSNCGWKDQPEPVPALSAANGSKDYDVFTKDAYQACKHLEGCYSKVVNCKSESDRDRQRFVDCMNN